MNDYGINYLVIDEPHF